MILDTEVSYFNSTYDIEVSGEEAIGIILEYFQDGLYQKEINDLRQGDKTIKQELPTFAFHGIFELSRKKKNFTEASGIIILDIDNIDPQHISEYKDSIMDESDHVLACMTSPSGNGIKVLYYVTPELITTENYRLIGKEVIKKFDDYGHVDFLSITDCLIATYDPDLVINEDVEPDYIYVIEPPSKGEVNLEPLDESKELWDDPEDFYDTVLYNDIAAKTNNNFHFIQVSVLDMKKFGFVHPSWDLSFIIDSAEAEFKSSSENKKRFLEVVEIAKQYPQTQWPYKTTRRDDDFKPDSIDYDSYVKSESKEVEDEEEDENGLINYTNFYDSVLKVIAEGDRVGFEVSFENFANVFRPKGTGICTVTGIPGHGKTEFIDALILDFARLYGHQTLVAGFEQSPEEHVIKLMRKLVGADITCKTYKDNETVRRAYDFVISKIKHIDTSKTGSNIHKILNAAGMEISASREAGGDPRWLVLDPFNMLSIKSRESKQGQIEEMLRLMTEFSHTMSIMILLVAHPFKMKKNEQTGQYEIPDFYSVKGSSAFFEMSYHGFVIYRMPSGSVLVKILKVKQNNMGTTNAEVFFDYTRASGRYIPIDEEDNELSGDHHDKDWLIKIEQQNKEHEQRPTE